jgi:hypothetical protein
MHQMVLRTIEGVFTWMDKFKHLLLQHLLGHQADIPMLSVIKNFVALGLQYEDDIKLYNRVTHVII